MADTLTLPASTVKFYESVSKIIESAKKLSDSLISNQKPIDKFKHVIELAGNIKNIVSGGQTNKTGQQKPAANIAQQLIKFVKPKNLFAQAESVFHNNIGRFSESILSFTKVPGHFMNTINKKTNGITGTFLKEFVGGMKKSRSASAKKSKGSGKSKGRYSPGKKLSSILASSLLNTVKSQLPKGVQDIITTVSQIGTAKSNNKKPSGKSRKNKKPSLLQSLNKKSATAKKISGKAQKLNAALPNRKALTSSGAEVTPPMSAGVVGQIEGKIHSVLQSVNQWVAKSSVLSDALNTVSSAADQVSSIFDNASKSAQKVSKTIKSANKFLGDLDKFAGSLKKYGKGGEILSRRLTSLTGGIRNFVSNSIVKADKGISKLSAGFKRLAISAGGKAKGAFTRVANGAGGLLARLKPVGNMVGRLGRVLGGGIVSALRTLSSGFLNIAAKAIPLVLNGLRILGTALLTNPIGLIITGIALAAGLIIAFWEPIKAFFGRLWGGVTAIFSKVWEWIKGVFLNFHPLGLIIKNWDAIKSFFVGLWNSVVSIFSSVWNWIKSIFSSLNPINWIVSAWSGVTDFFSGLWDSVVGLFSGFWNWVTGFFTSFSPVEMIAGLWSGVTDFFAGLWDGVVAIVSGAVDWIMDIIAAPIKWLGSLFGFGDDDDEDRTVTKTVIRVTELDSNTAKAMELEKKTNSGKIQQITKPIKKVAATAALSSAIAIAPSVAATPLTSKPLLNPNAAGNSVHKESNYQINIQPSPGMDEQQLARMVQQQLQAKERQDEANQRGLLHD